MEAHGGCIRAEGGREVSTPLEPYVHGDLVIDFAQHRANLG